MDQPPIFTRRGAVFSSWLGLALAAGAAVVLLWFMQKVVTAILMLFFAVVVAIALSAPVGWFRRRGLSRRLAALVTLLLFFAVIGLLGALVVPRVASQLVELLRELPEVVSRLQAQINALLTRYPDLQAFAGGNGQAAESVPGTLEIFRGLSGASLSLLGFLALTLIFFTIVVYVVIDPRPIIRAYYGSLPVAHRRAGMRAYRRASAAVIGWTEASFVVGAIQAVAVFVFLSLMHVPGALVWAALAFFADFIPRIGGYVMAFPPVVLSLTIDPMTALWVGLFYLISNEILGSVVAPKIRGARMRLHPVLLIFFTLAFALAFGVLGAIVATPAAAFAAAYYGEFYLKRPVRRVPRLRS
ncbi:AI-2E family transporter [Sphingosinicella terrae]|uniref:AI-2E family transporter n=1 Tax=Sphingosinicella terrae TaxID=2172047 RepID=UPI000E0D2A98|nr:AI-2E family transporter [Sphingosinicella terrae]